MPCVSGSEATITCSSSAWPPLLAHPVRPKSEPRGRGKVAVTAAAARTFRELQPNGYGRSPVLAQNRAMLAAVAPSGVG